MADVKMFAGLTAINENRGIRRTILLVPAMTTRSADYSVLGQAAFLSSGLTTVFCNAVCTDYGHGQSCFIGHDGWLDKKPAAGMPTTTPYHGAEPGIFHLDHEKSGRLGKNEQALVIADIDPIYGAEGRPRPQTLLKPLQLVAHLPVIETWQASPPQPDGPPPACCCGPLNRSLEKVGEFAPALLSALKFGIDDNWSTTGKDRSPGVLAAALERLANCAGLPHSVHDNESSRGWLMERRKKYLADHLADPNPWPPPVALDWLWVDPGPIEIGSFPEIEVPEYAAPPGGDPRIG